MESIEKLRGLKCEGLPCTRARKIADAIQSEIDERYMALPLDADGVPIHVGDLIEYRCIEGTYRLHAQGVYVYREGRCKGKKCVMNERLGIWFPELCYHVKPRTLEDVLRDVWKEALDYAKSDIWRNPDEVFAERADEIRELMGGDA